MGRSPFLGRSDKDNLESQLASIEAQKLTSRVPFVEGRQRSFTVEQYLSNNVTNVNKTVEQVTVNNYYSGSGGSGSGGTGETETTAHPSLPTTAYGFGVVSRAMGSALVSSLAADGRDDIGIITHGTFRPLDLLSGAYNVAPLNSMPLTSGVGYGGALQYASDDQYWGSPFGGGVPTYNSSAGPGLHAYPVCPVRVSSHSLVAAVDDVSAHTLNLLRLNGTTTPDEVATSGNITTVGAIWDGGNSVMSNSSYCVVPLGSTSSGRVYVAATKYVSSAFFYSVFYYDAAAAHSAFVANGSVQDLNNHITVIYATSGSSSSTVAGISVTRYYNAGMDLHSAGALSGRDYAWIRAGSSSTSISRINLTTGVLTRYTLPSAVKPVLQTNPASSTSGSNPARWAVMNAIHIRSPEWGSSQDEFVSWRVGTRSDGVTEEVRLCKFGPWGVEDITPVDSGVLYDNSWHSNASQVVSVPQSVASAEFNGGQPTHISYYIDNGSGDSDQGVHYVPLSAI